MRVRLNYVDDKYLYYEVRVPKRQLKTTEVVKLTDITARLLYPLLAGVKDKSNV